MTIIQLTEESYIVIVASGTDTLDNKRAHMLDGGE
jgi:hypothetical protein